jgi:hypothetical protein
MPQLKRLERLFSVVFRDGLVAVGPILARIDSGDDREAVLVFIYSF